MRRCIYKKIHYLTFDLGDKVTRNVIQYPLHHVTYAATKLLGKENFRKYKGPLFSLRKKNTGIKIHFFVNTKYIKSYAVEISALALVLRTFTALHEMYLVFTSKKGNIINIFRTLTLSNHKSIHHYFENVNINF